MATDRIHTAVRAPEAWISAIDKLAERLGISRNAAILAAGRIGARALLRLRVSKAQLEELLREDGR